MDSGRVQNPMHGTGSLRYAVPALACRFGRHPAASSRIKAMPPQEFKKLYTNFRIGVSIQ